MSAYGVSIHLATETGMNAFNRKQHWENVYRNRAPSQVSWYQSEPSVSLQLIEACGAGPEDAIIDVGGGASVLVDRLLARGHEAVAVLDLSGAALATARERLGRGADRVEWYEADVTGFVAPHRYRIWHDRAVFHFLTEPDDRRRYAEVLRQTIPAGGCVIIASFALDGPTQCSGLDIERYDAEKLLAALGGGFELRDSVSESHLTPAGDRQRFQYFRLQRL